MRPLPRLEAEPKSGAIFGRLFLAEALRFDIAHTAPYPVAMHGVSQEFIDNGLGDWRHLPG
jgi:hypothetical protein